MSINVTGCLDRIVHVSSGLMSVIPEAGVPLISSTCHTFTGSTIPRHASDLYPRRTFRARDVPYAEEDTGERSAYTSCEDTVRGGARPDRPRDLEYGVRLLTLFSAQYCSSRAVPNA